MGNRNRERIPPETRERIFERDGRRCLNCGTTQQLTIDHIVPWSLGGTECDSNLQTLCGTCNVIRGDTGLALPFPVGSPSDPHRCSDCNGRAVAAIWPKDVTGGPPLWYACAHHIGQRAGNEYRIATL